MDDLISGFYRSTKVTTDTLGDVELKYVSFGDMIAFEKIMQESISDRDFTGKVLFNQIVTPAFEFDSIQNLPDEQLEKLARALIELENHTFEFFVESGNFYKDFKQSLVAKQEEQNEELRKLVEPVIRSTQQRLAAFSRDYASVITQAINHTSYISDSLSSVAEMAVKIADDQFRLISSLKPAIDQLSFAADIVTEVMRPQIEFWQKWVEQNSRLFDSFRHFWSGFQEQFNIAESEASRILRRYKWFITPSIPRQFVFQVVELGNRPGRQDRAVNLLFIDYFEADDWRNLRRMAGKWKTNPLLKSRYKILVDCVKAVRMASRKRINIANVVLPTLITQIDGAISDYLNQKQITWDTAYDDWTDRKTGKTKVGRKTQLKNTKPRVLTTQLDDLANDIFLNILFQHSQKGKPLDTPFNFNRHKIVHGETVRYGRMDYMIRAFMVLDLLAHWGKSV